MAEKRKRRKSPRALLNRIDKVQHSLDEVENCVEDLRMLVQMNRLFVAGSAIAAEALSEPPQEKKVERDFLMVA